MTGALFKFLAPFSRRLPDPVHAKSLGIERHIMLVPVRNVPKDLPLDPNARVPNVNRRVYKEIERSLFNDGAEPGTFHLKHKGITVVASKVSQTRDGEVHITIEPGQGILDGGHTYTLITMERGETQLPDNQFVKFEILTGIPAQWIPEMAGGLNTSLQVQPMSLDHLAGKFNWLKDLLRSEPYYKYLAWKENEDGELDARDLVSILTCFNTRLFPNDGDGQPVVAYEKKSAALKHFEEDPKSYEELKPIVKDILLLHDVIRKDSGTYWNAEGGRYGKLAFVEARSRGDFLFPFSGQRSKYRLTNGALYPMLAAFRWMVQKDKKTGLAGWSGGFDSVLERWRGSAAELMRMTAQASQELGRNPNAIGKSRNHWANLHARVAMRDLLQKTMAERE